MSEQKNTRLSIKKSGTFTGDERGTLETVEYGIEQDIPNQSDPLTDKVDNQRFLEHAREIKLNWKHNTDTRTKECVILTIEDWREFASASLLTDVSEQLP